MSNPATVKAFPPAHEFMRTEVKTVATTTPLADVARLLAEHQVSGMPVTDEAGHIVGVLSMRDILEQYADEGVGRGFRSFYDASSEAEDTRVDGFEVPYDCQERAGDVMTAQVHAVDKDALLPEVARHMVNSEYTVCSSRTRASTSD